MKWIITRAIWLIILSAYAVLLSLNEYSDGSDFACLIAQIEPVAVKPEITYIVFILACVPHKKNSFINKLMHVLIKM